MTKKFFNAKFAGLSHISLHSQKLLPDLMAGLVVGIIALTTSVAIAALIFSEELSGEISTGIGIMLFGSLVLGGLTALTSSLPCAVATLQEAMSIVLALSAVTIVHNMPASATYQERLATVITMIALTSTLVGITFLMLGQFKLGNLIRFIPYPVIGGFLAGTGLLLVLGALSVILDTSFNLAQLPILAQTDLLVKWLPGLAVAMLILIVTRRYSHPLILPGILFMATILFYFLLWITPFSLSDAIREGWLLSSTHAIKGGIWRPLTIATLSQVNWHILGDQIGKIVVILVISTVSFLLNATGIELATGHDIDLNHELKASGFSNVIAGLSGSMGGFHALSDTALVHKMGARGRLVGLTLAVCCGVVLWADSSLLTFFPKFVLGGLILFQGLDFLVTWVYEAWFKLRLAEFLIVIMILLVMNTVGLLQGILLGVVAAVVLFVVDYSRVNVVKHTLSGTNFQSNVDRPLLYQRLLHQKGDWLFILKLQGYVFFGTANQLLNQIRQRINASNMPELQYIVLDFSQVSGLDASALLCFSRLKQLAQIKNIHLVFTHLSPKIQQQLERQVFGEEDRTAWRTFPDLDHGVEWCEEQMIQIFESVGLIAKPRTPLRHLEDVLPRNSEFFTWLNHSVHDQEQKLPSDSFTMQNVIPYMERMKVNAGHVLIRQGDPPRGLFFIESGQVSIQLDGQDGHVIRLRKRGAGTVVGEMGLYRGTPATASVVADQTSVVYYLSAENLRRMEESEPEVASSFHKLIAQHLSERLASTSETLQALLDITS